MKRAVLRSKGYLVLLMLALLGVGCTNSVDSGPQMLYIPILADASWLLADGTFISGVDMAVEELNREYADKGFTVRTEVIDDQASYELGVEKAAELAGDAAVTAVLNLQNFDVSKTTGDMLASAGKVVLFPYGAYDSLFTRDNPYLFCGVPSFAVLGEAMARYVDEAGYGVPPSTTTGFNPRTNSLPPLSGLCCIVRLKWLTMCPP